VNADGVIDRDRADLADRPAVISRRALAAWLTHDQLLRARDSRVLAAANLELAPHFDGWEEWIG